MIISIAPAIVAARQGLNDDITEVISSPYWSLISLGTSAHIEA